jgi:pSer/pThr/pTyr-binding forkhead associated (FHA) protein
MTPNPEPTPIEPSRWVSSRASGRHKVHSYLQQIEGKGSPTEFILEKPELVLGRDVDADIVLRSKRTSPRHALLQWRDGEYILRDQESAEGVYLNGVRVHSAVLRDGDVILLGDLVFLYEEG